MVIINRHITWIVQEHNTFSADSTPGSAIMYPTTGSSIGDNSAPAAVAARSKAPASSPSSSVYPLFALFVFKNVFNQDLIRSIHVHQAGGHEKWIYREFLFSPGSCVEIRAVNLGILLPASMPVETRRQRFQVGNSLGMWTCILAFDPAMDPWVSYSFSEIICPSRNPRLKFVPTLSDDLGRVFQMILQAEMSQVELTEKLYYSTIQGAPYPEDAHSSTMVSNNPETHHEMGSHKTLQNDFPAIEERIQEFPVSINSKKAAKERVARITLSDIAEHFNLPIAEAAKKLNLGITVLKNKCRDFGILRWPFRKIRSLDTLIHNLQEEARRQERENKPLAARRAVEKRKRMLESEKEQLEKFPSLELCQETKDFRQCVFKLNHKAKGKKAAKGVNGNNFNLPPLLPELPKYI